jgi:2-polyprenyl-6-methoxyphenol hydroxylase-like FAD-dependent oxidoreductase
VINMAYDVIVVGARVAGSSTGMLLARSGLRVLVVDQTSFPSDTLSSHQVQPPGVALLRNWGLLDRVVAAGTPATREVRFHSTGSVLEGDLSANRVGEPLYSPRRTVLDSILVDAAREAGAEVRERTRVTDLVLEDGRVVGVQTKTKGGSAATERAGIVVGADGKHSLVAKAARSRLYRERPARSVSCYAYWQDVGLQAAQIHGLDRRVAGAWPTNDGLVVTFVAWPAEDWEQFRRDPDRSIVETLDQTGELGARLRAGQRVGPVRATNDVPNRFVRAYGPGWALVGDAGLVMDPITGQGIGHALRDAHLLADAITSGLGGRRSPAKALGAYQKQRDQQARGMYNFTVRLATLPPPSAAERMWFAAIAERPDQSARFFACLTGVEPITEFMSPRNVIDLVGTRGLAKFIQTQLRQPRRPRRATA